MTVAEAIRERLPNGGDGREAQLVLAAFDGESGIEALLEGGELPVLGGTGAGATPVGAYVTSLAVEGFRGIGERAQLQLAPGPALTLVVGRNGSGKSSFAEAFEVLLTGDNQRWLGRSAVWREGWRNLHHGSTSIDATLNVEGFADETLVQRKWSQGAELDEGEVELQAHGKPKTGLDFLGWDDALATHRPFLSYSELGAMLDEGPTKLHDAVSAVLGLDELTQAEKALKDARLRRERQVKEVMRERDEVCSLLDGVEDERARRATAALRLKQPALEVVEEVVRGAEAPESDKVVTRLRRLQGYSFVSQEVIASSAAELVDAREELAGLAGTHAAQMLKTAELLEQAVTYRDEFGGETCPVCATAGVLTKEWARDAAANAAEQRAAAREAQQATTRATKAKQQAQALISAVPSAIQEVRELLDTSEVIEAWTAWVGLQQVEGPEELAEGLLEHGAAVSAAVERLRAAAEQELARREDAWRPVALSLAAWLERARDAQQAAAVVPDLKAAETWLKQTAMELRNERFAPIADEALEIWRLLRQNSNVELGRIEFEGAGVRRRVTLDVTVDGVRGAALGVMSQGELHALALSLFFPRATLDESPFRFIVIDDPVQSMDPSKVDGLAKVLARAASKRQVIVFTHDDRLPEAVRRLRIEATVLEVTRREESVVEVRAALTPIERHIEDARALIRTTDLPEEVARRVVPGFCRLALEAASVEAVRRRRIGRGEQHAVVEAMLEKATRLTTFVALVLFDDDSRGGDVLPRLQSEFGNQAASTFRAVNAGAHEPFAGDLRNLVRDAAVLARQLAERQ